MNLMIYVLHTKNHYVTRYTITTNALPQKTNSIIQFIDATKKNKNYFANG